MKRALLSVSDKTGIVEFAKELVELGYEVLSTGGTKKAIEEAGVKVTGVSDATGFPEILEGRVKTLHPTIHGGILAKGTKEHMDVIKEHNIQPIEIVCVNLYPFVETIMKPGVSLEDAIENIDIGGPTMVRSAAKNYGRVAVIVKPERYGQVVSEIKEKGEVSLETRQKLSLEAFSHTAEYDSAISQYLNTVFNDDLAETFSFAGEKIQTLRYGENPHQKAAFYKFQGDTRGTIAGADQLHGKELSYNNIVDLEAAWNVVNDFKGDIAACVIKHTNPCGTAIGETLKDAYVKAYAADSMSAYGGIIGVNRTLDKDTAEEIAKTFVEAVIAPDFSQEALEILTAKKNIRLIKMGTEEAKTDLWIEKVTGGFLVQERDQVKIDLDEFEVVTEKQPSEEDLKELIFAWKVVKNVKSNAIVLTKDKISIGVGAGQMNRVGAAKIAFEQAGENSVGGCLASDAFFPFRDTVDEAHKAGVKAIIQPGGSIRDEESIKACNEHGMIMIFTKRRHFKH